MESLRDVMHFLEKKLYLNKRNNNQFFKSIYVVYYPKSHRMEHKNLENNLSSKKEHTIFIFPFIFVSIEKG